MTCRAARSRRSGRRRPGRISRIPISPVCRRSPTQPDRAALANIASALIADRTNAQHLAAAAPLPDPSLPSASPALFGRGTVPPPTPAAPPGTAPASATHVCCGGAAGAGRDQPVNSHRARGGAGSGEGPCCLGAERAACPAWRGGSAARRRSGATACVARRPAAAAEPAPGGNCRTAPARQPAAIQQLSRSPAPATIAAATPSRRRQPQPTP